MSEDIAMGMWAAALTGTPLTIGGKKVFIPEDLVRNLFPESVESEPEHTETPKMSKLELARSLAFAMRLAQEAINDVGAELGMFPAPLASAPASAPIVQAPTPSPEPAEPKPLSLERLSDGSLRIVGRFEIRPSGRGRCYVVESVEGRDLLRAWHSCESDALSWVRDALDNPQPRLLNR